MNNLESKQKQKRSEGALKLSRRDHNEVNIASIFFFCFQPEDRLKSQGSYNYENLYNIQYEEPEEIIVNKKSHWKMRQKDRDKESQRRGGPNSGHKLFPII